VSVGLWSSAALLALLPMFALLTALVERSGPIRMRHWVEESGGRLRSLYENPSRFAVFRYLLNLCAKIVPLALFAAFAKLFLGFGFGQPFLVAGVLVAVAMATSEVASRSLLKRDPEEALRRLTGLYRLTSALFAPIILAVAPLVRVQDEEEENETRGVAEEASEEEVEAFIDVGTKEGILEPADRELVWGVVDFGDTQVKSVMTPRVDIVAAKSDEPLDAVVKRVLEASVSRLPIYLESIDQIVGVVHLRDLLEAVVAESPANVVALAKPAMLVPETKLLGELLKEFQAKRQQMAIVIDEFGGTQGLVTIEDLIEEIVGEIQDEHDDAEPENQILEDGSLLLDGRAPVELLDEQFGWRPEEANSETVGGLVSGVLGYVPGGGEAIELHGLRFEVERADERRILTLRVRRAAEEHAAADG
jgi:CBS domain containing-hemolysin-like protein